jgi:L-ascorbate metabolism protein UlaG (beta-lactamase superfamily)
MRLVKYAHSCVRVERDGAVLVIDPGGFSERESLDGADAILITHEHADHLDVDKIGDALDKRPGIRVYAPAEVVAKLPGLPATTVASGETFRPAGFEVRAYGAWHGVIHPDLPPVANLGYLIEGSVYHPGDSFDVPEGVDIETLFVPISAPWLKISESIDFVRAVKPRRAYALHDAIAGQNIVGTLDRLVSSLGGAEYERLTPGTVIGS